MIKYQLDNSLTTLFMVTHLFLSKIKRNIDLLLLWSLMLLSAAGSGAEIKETKDHPNESKPQNDHKSKFCQI